MILPPLPIPTFLDYFIPTTYLFSRDLEKSDKRPPSSMSTGSADSGVFSSGVHASSPSHSQGSSSQSGPPSPTTQLNSLLFETANLIAVNEQLRKEIAELVLFCCLAPVSCASFARKN